MVVDRPDTNSFDDNTGAALAAGTLTRGELLRSAANICRFVLQSPAMERELGIHDGTVEVVGLDEEAGQAIDFDVTYRHLESGEAVQSE